jgi:hypothetical protein
VYAAADAAINGRKEFELELTPERKCFFNIFEYKYKFGAERLLSFWAIFCCSPLDRLYTHFTLHQKIVALN